MPKKPENMSHFEWSFALKISRKNKPVTFYFSRLLLSTEGCYRTDLQEAARDGSTSTQGCRRARVKDMRWDDAGECLYIYHISFAAM